MVAYDAIRRLNSDARFLGAPLRPTRAQSEAVARQVEQDRINAIALRDFIESMTPELLAEILPAVLLQTLGPDAAQSIGQIVERTADLARGT